MGPFVGILPIFILLSTFYADAGNPYGGHKKYDDSGEEVPLYPLSNSQGYYNNKPGYGKPGYPAVPAYGKPSYNHEYSKPGYGGGEYSREEDSYEHHHYGSDENSGEYGGGNYGGGRTYGKPGGGYGPGPYGPPHPPPYKGPVYPGPYPPQIRYPAPNGYPGFIPPPGYPTYPGYPRPPFPMPPYYIPSTPPTPPTPPTVPTPGTPSTTPNTQSTTSGTGTATTATETGTTATETGTTATTTATETPEETTTTARETPGVTTATETETPGTTATETETSETTGGTETETAETPTTGETDTTSPSDTETTAETGGTATTSREDIIRTPTVSGDTTPTPGTITPITYPSGTTPKPPPTCTTGCKHTDLPLKPGPDGTPWCEGTYEQPPGCEQTLVTCNAEGGQSVREVFGKFGYIESKPGESQVRGLLYCVDHNHKKLWQRNGVSGDNKKNFIVTEITCEKGTASTDPGVTDEDQTATPPVQLSRNNAPPIKDSSLAPPGFECANTCNVDDIELKPNGQNGSPEIERDFKEPPQCQKMVAKCETPEGTTAAMSCNEPSAGIISGKQKPFNRVRAMFYCVKGPGGQGVQWVRKNLDGVQKVIPVKSLQCTTTKQ